MRLSDDVSKQSDGIYGSGVIILVTLVLKVKQERQQVELIAKPVLMIIFLRTYLGCMYVIN